MIQPGGPTEANTRKSHAGDLESVNGSTSDEIVAANRQAADTNDIHDEWVVEDSVAERGGITHGTKKYLVKYVGHPDTTWEPADILGTDCRPRVDFKSKTGHKASSKNKSQAASKNQP